jgi:hypothetical protein
MKVTSLENNISQCIYVTGVPGTDAKFPPFATYKIAGGKVVDSYFQARFDQDSLSNPGAALLITYHNSPDGDRRESFSYVDNNTCERLRIPIPELMVIRKEFVNKVVPILNSKLPANVQEHLMLSLGALVRNAN